MRAAVAGGKDGAVVTDDPAVCGTGERTAEQCLRRARPLRIPVRATVDGGKDGAVETDDPAVCGIGEGDPVKVPRSCARVL